MRTQAAKALTFLLLACGGALSPATAAADDRQRDHEELRAMARTITSAVNSNRLDDLLPLLAKDAFLTMVDQTLLTEPGQLKEYFRKNFEASGAILKSVHIAPEADVLTNLLDDVTGVNHGTSTDTYTLRNGRQVVLNTRWSGTFRKIDGRWKIASLHVGVNMLDNPILKAVESLKYLWGAGGLVAGAVFGVLATWLLRRRRAVRGA